MHEVLGLQAAAARDHVCPSALPRVAISSPLHRISVPPVGPGRSYDGRVLGRSSEVRKTPLGQSLAGLGGRDITRYLWKELERLGEPGALNSRAESVIAGTMDGGYIAVWALAVSELVVLTEREGRSRIIPLAQVEGLVRPAEDAIRVLLGGTEFVALRSPDAAVAAFARAIADRAHAPLADGAALFSADGFVQLVGTPIRIRGQYLGGFPELAPGHVEVVFDDAGVHLVPFATPWWQARAIPWDTVREIVVEGQEETRRRVTAARMMAVGILALAIPKDENASYAYLTVAAAAGDVVVRIEGARPQELKVQLGDVLRRPAAEPEGGQAGPGVGGDLAGQVARLGELHRSGVLTDEEFTAAKRKLLDL